MTVLQKLGKQMTHKTLEIAVRVCEGLEQGKLKPDLTEETEREFLLQHLLLARSCSGSLPDA